MSLYLIFDMLSLRFQETLSQHLKPDLNLKCKRCKVSSHLWLKLSVPETRGKKIPTYLCVGLIKKKKK
jgi:hypothetical protein